MHHVTFLQDLAVVMIVAAVVTILFRQLKQPVVLGYILAGVIIGPHTPPFPLVADQHTIQTLSELGVIFLMFALGLEFSLRKLREVGATALIAAVFEILLMMWAGYQLGLLFGWKQMDSVFLGAILSISSTTIIIKALEEMNKTRERFANLIFGILIVEDILAIVMIALLSGFATTGSLAPAEIGHTVVRLGGFLGVVLVLGLIAVPRLLDYVAKFRSSEMLLVTVIGLCFGVSLVAVKLGYSVALGAFLIGAVIAEARQIAKIETLMHPVRDLFSAVFFVSIGLLIDPKLLWQYAGPILIITVVVIVGKVVACSFGTFVAGNDRQSSLRVGMGLAQIGEFSFIIAALGLSLKVTSDFLYPIAVAVSALTTLSTPYLIRGSDALVGLFDRVAPKSLHDFLDAYTEWIGRLSDNRTENPGRRFLRRWAWQMALNLLLVSAIFIAVISFKGRAAAWFPWMPAEENGLKAALWLAAMLVSLPLLIATFRKLQAMALLIGELSVSAEAAGTNVTRLRSLVSTIVVLAGTLAIILVVMLLSSAILPSRNALLFAGLMVVLVAIFLWRAFIRLYAKAQGALQETLTQPPAPRHPEPTPIPSLLADAQLKVLTIPQDSPAVGRVIGELRLRTVTGASIVGIERPDENLINPGPEEEIRAEDRVLVIGSNDQLTGAEKFLTTRAEAASEA